MHRGLRVLAAIVASVLLAIACAPSDPAHEDDRGSRGTSRAALTRTLPCTADTYVKSGAPNQNQGTLPTVRLQASGNNRALIACPTAAIAELVVGTTVTLKLRIADNGENWSASGRPIAVHRLTETQRKCIEKARQEFKRRKEAGADSCTNASDLQRDVKRCLGK
jgi:hypothetical protein